MANFGEENNARSEEADDSQEAEEEDDPPLIVKTATRKRPLTRPPSPVGNSKKTKRSYHYVNIFKISLFLQLLLLVQNHPLRRNQNSVPAESGRFNCPSS